MLDESPNEQKIFEGRQSFVSFFGKHRAWADHMDDLGLATPSLHKFKNWLYVEGIRGQIDSGSWNEIPEASAIPYWNHKLFALGPSGLIFAALLHSPDSRGRDAYPLCLALHIPTTQLPSELAPLWQFLDDLARDVLAAETQEEVIALHESAPAMLGEVMRTLSPLSTEGPSAAERNRFINSESFSPQRIGLRRFLYWMSQELTNYALPAKVNKTPKPKHCRLPLSSDMGAEALLLWLSLLRSQIKSNTLLICVSPTEHQFCDLLVGTLEPNTTFQFKVGVTSEPLISDIPYNIEMKSIRDLDTVISLFPNTSLDRLPQIIVNDSEHKGNSIFGTLTNRLFKS